MQCPYCAKEIHAPEGIGRLSVVHDEKEMVIQAGYCPSCEGPIVHYYTDEDWETHIIIYPKVSSRGPLPSVVPVDYRTDYEEAALVLADSPKASAALSRRALQRFLREEMGIEKRSLAQEIDEFISSGKHPTYILDAVDAVRNIGNFAAHPLKDTHTGEIVEVEPGEAEWLLEVLEALFDYHFVKPQKLEAQREALNEKLKSLGKPPIKSSQSLG